MKKTIKKETKTEAITPRLEVYIHEHKGINIAVQIDYIAETISLVEADGHNAVAAYKKWIFGGREIQYMQGWRDILEAMKKAIDSAEQKLKEYQDKEAEKKLELQIKLADAIKEY